MIGKLLIFAAATALAAGCSGPAARPGSGQATKVQDTPSTRHSILINTAASAQEPLEALAKEFTKQSGVPVKINPGPSSGLAQMILAGAPVDLFLSAHPQWVEKLEQAKLTAQTKRLLTNRLVLAAPKGNPAQVQKPQDLTSPAVKKLALAGENVPAGQYAQQALGKLELLATLQEQHKIVRGQDVRGVLRYLELGEVEAGIVYATDLAAAPEAVLVYEFPAALHDEIVYALALIQRAGRPAEAKEFFDFLGSQQAQKTFIAAGFQMAEKAVK